MKHLKIALAMLLASGSFKMQAQCTASGGHYTANYSSGWTLTDPISGSNLSTATNCNFNENRNGTISGSGNTVSFLTARNARELRLTSAVPVVSNTNWTMDFKLEFTTPPSGSSMKNNSPGVVLAALTADPMDLVVSCGTSPAPFCNPCSSYNNTNTDAIYVCVESDIPATCQESSGTQATRNWRLVAYSREGSTTPIASSPIAITSGFNGTYFVRLERTGSSSALLSVFSNSTFSTHLAGSPVCFSVPSTVTGLDNLSHEIQAQGGCNRVFNGKINDLKIDNSTICPVTASVSLSTIPPVCQGTAISATGSASSTLPISGHSWMIRECDAMGNEYGPSWSSSIISGSPAPFTFSYSAMTTAGITARCGYFKVTLNVLTCAGSAGSQATIAQVYCPPVIDFKNMEQKICLGESVNLNADVSGGSGNYNVNWTPVSPPGPSIYSGPNTTVTVTPGVNTIYQCFVSDNVTGCTASSNWQVFVSTNDPTFNISLAASNSSYYTIDLTATDLTAGSAPGFTYSYKIEELDGSGNPYYVNSGSNCWHNYPAAEVFEGFVSTGIGTYTQFTGSPCGQEGKFLFCRTYRITRTTQNFECPPATYAVLMRNCDRDGLVITPVRQGPAGLILNSSSSIAEPSVSPNPTRGIVLITLPDGTDKAAIEVYNDLGKLVKSSEQDTPAAEIDLSKMPKGIYLVKIVSGQKNITRKIVLE